MTIQDVEAAREAYYQKTKRNWLIVGTIAGVLIIALFLSQLSTGHFELFILPFFVAFFVFVLGTIINTFTTKKEAAAYSKAYKAYFVEQNLRAIFSGLTYSHDQGITKQFLDSTGMVDTGDRYSSNDYTSGHYKNVLFSQADVNISERRTDSDGDTYSVTIFMGKFMVFEFPKRFNFKLELVGKKFGAYRIPGKNATSGREMQKISTESEEFNRSLKVFGEDGFEAYYILDPAFMVKIMDITTHYDGKILFGFTNNQLLIGLNNGKDSFEPPKKLSQPIDEAKENQRISSDIKIITDFVDQLSLARKLFQ